MKVKEYIAQEEENLSELSQRLKLVRKIFNLALMINEQGKYYCFIRLAAHISSVDVYITPIGDYHKYLFCLDAYYNSAWIQHGEMLGKLETIVNNLLKYLEDDNDLLLPNL